MSLFDKFENHSLYHLRQTLEEAAEGAPALVPTLENHHAYLKESIAILTDIDVAPESKQFHLARFLHVLNMHSRAEEETLYRRLMRDEEKDGRISGIASQEEHDVAYQLADDLDELGFTQRWTEDIDAKAKVLANLVRNHLKEEETILFPLAKRLIDEDELLALADSYVEKCRNYLAEEIEASRYSPTPGANAPL